MVQHGMDVSMQFWASIIQSNFEKLIELNLQHYDATLIQLI